MIKNTANLPQPLNSRAYNDYLSQKIQNPTINAPTTNTYATNPMQSQTEQINSNQLDVSNFASELRSQKTVSALMNLSHSKKGFAPTLAEQGATIDKNGNISIPKNTINNAPTTALGNSARSASFPAATASGKTSGAASGTASGETIDKTAENIKTRNTSINTSPQEQIIGIPLNGRNKTSKNSNFGLNGMRSFALDTRSLGVLNKVSARKDLSQFDNASPQGLSNQKKTAEDTDIKTKIKSESSENSSQIGKLSAQYESSTKGSTSIGYDKNGGTSYGTYQISSKAGTFDQFLNFLDKEAPKWSQKLRDAGTTNTGSRSGSVPDTWKQLCAEDPEKMKTLEHDFIIKSHYEPVATHVEEKWKGNISTALREVIFSTAVQHGVNGAKHVFNQAFADIPSKKSLSSSLTHSLNKSGTGETGVNNTQENAVSFLMNSLMQGQKNNNSNANNSNNSNSNDSNNTNNNSNNTSDSKQKETTIKNTDNLQAQATLIKNVYAHRENKFGSSTLQVQESAKNRFINEQKQALSMLS